MIILPVLLQRSSRTLLQWKCNEFALEILKKSLCFKKNVARDNFFSIAAELLAKLLNIGLYLIYLCSNTKRVVKSHKLNLNSGIFIFQRGSV